MLGVAGIDAGGDLDPVMLHGIYERIKSSEFKPGSDHVTQVLKVEGMIFGKKPVKHSYTLAHALHVARFLKVGFVS